MADEGKKDWHHTHIEIEFSKPLKLMKSCPPSPPFSDAKLQIVEGEFKVKISTPKDVGNE
jgi:hypothetical protein